MIFGIVLEVLQINELEPAVNFKPVVFPNKWQKRVREESKGEVTKRGEVYRNFFQGVIDTLREKHQFTRAQAAQPQSWYTYSSGVSGVVYGTSFAAGDRARVELYLDKGNREANKALFDWLAEKKEEIQQEIPEKIKWERLDDKKASRIAIYRHGNIDESEIMLKEIQGWMIERVLLFKEVFGLILKNY